MVTGVGAGCASDEAPGPRFEPQEVLGRRTTRRGESGPRVCRSRGPRVACALDARRSVAERSLCDVPPLGLLPDSVQRQVRRKRQGGARRAAVLVPFCEIDGELSCVFSVRSAKVSTHKSQVSFPGGHFEDGETAVETALREAREEFGSDFQKGFDAVDECDDVRAITGTIVTPVVGCRADALDLGADVEFCDSEVASVFSLPVAHLLDDRNREVKTYERRGVMPIFHGGPEPIWGLTAYILDGVLENLVRPCYDAGPASRPC